MSTKYAGKGGSVEIPIGTEITGIKSWTLDQVADVLETTSFDDDGVKAYIGACTGFSGSFEGYKTETQPELAVAGAVTSMKLKETGTDGQWWTMDCILTGRTVASSFDGLVTYSYTFQGTGALGNPTA